MTGPYETAGCKTCTAGRASACKCCCAECPIATTCKGKQVCRFTTSSAVRWIINNSVSDPSFNVKNLTDDEVLYCLAVDKRQTAQKKLWAEKNRRRKKGTTP